MFRSREFAGYLRFPIPHPPDARVLAALTDRRMRDQMKPDDVGILAIFGHRKAVEAVRTKSVATLKAGFLGTAVASELNGDYREVCMGLVVLFHCARLLQVTETGFSPPQAAVPLGRAVRRFQALTRCSTGIAVSSLLCENGLVGTLHLTNRRMMFGGFRGKSFPRIKASTCFGRGALRLSQS